MKDFNDLDSRLRGNDTMCYVITKSQVTTVIFDRTVSLKYILPPIPSSKRFFLNIALLLAEINNRGDKTSQKQFE